MNAGLTNLERLKRHLLPASMGADKQWDQVITDIGTGVAALFNAACNRDLDYAEGCETIVSGDREHFILPRYPIHRISSIQMRYFDSQPWQDIAGQPIRTNPQKGIVYFGGTLGTEALQVKLVWSGGFWFNALEPQEDGYNDPAPEGVAPMPKDLIAAFLLQCRAVWQAVDKTGAGILKTGSTSAFVSGSLPELKIIPLVEQMLREYVRYQLS